MVLSLIDIRLSEWLCIKNIFCVLFLSGKIIKLCYVQSVYFVLQDGVTAEIMALAQGFTDISDILSKVKGVCWLTAFSGEKKKPVYFGIICPCFPIYYALAMIYRVQVIHKLRISSRRWIK